MAVKESIKEKSFVLSADIDWEVLGEGVKRKVLGYDDQIMMVHFHFEKGAVGSLHHHVHRQVAYVESGRFEVTINGEMKILEKGDSYFVAPNLVHGVVALEAGALIDVFTPARQDFV